MDSSSKKSVTSPPAKTPQSKSKISEALKDENQNPNLRSPSLKKQSKSPSIKSNKKPTKSPANNPNPNPVILPPEDRIKERKFVVVKRKGKIEKANSSKLKCNCKDRVGNKCLCLAYDSLRASQEEFFKPCIDVSPKKGSSPEEVFEFRKTGNLRASQQESSKPQIDDSEANSSSPDEVSEFREMGGLNNKRGRNVVPEPGSGKVMSLIKAFERLQTDTPDSRDAGQKGERESEGSDKTRVKLELQIKAPETQLSSSSICPSDFLVSSSLDTSQGSFTFSSKGSRVGRRSQRNSTELSGTFGGRRWRKKQQLKATRQQPFKLLTEQRGRTKEEEFSKKLQEMMVEEQKQRIPIAQGLPWTTDEPENLVKPPVKEFTIPIDLVLHSDMRAADRAEFDQQLAEKEALIEQYRMERERQQKLAEEEEIKRLRKELIPKAQPMPYFDRPFIPRRKHHVEGLK